MDVRLLESTPDPEELVCRAARNDYMEAFNPDLSFEETMETVEGDTIEEKKETLIGHLLRHGHYGPFEHAQATFAVKGCSRTCMAQITRHRHVSFDVRSIREFDGEPAGRYGLTDEQYRALVAAARAGYFDVPRAAELESLAAQFDISHQALSGSSG